MAYDLSGRIFMVTGSSSGIGRSIAIALAQRGADVILHGRQPSEALDQVAKTIKAMGRETHSLFADFEEPSVLETFVKDAWKWRGRVDGWINNAGGDVLTGPLKDQTFEQKLDYLLKTDVTATLMLSRLAGRQMIADSNAAESDESNNESSELSSATRIDKVIINIGWDQAWQGMEGDSGELFAATKGAIMSMTKSLAQSLAPSVRVNCIAPGWIETKWGQNASDYWNRRAQSDSLMNRWGKPEDVAEAALYLSTTSFVSGHILPVNGGFRFFD